MTSLLPETFVFTQSNLQSYVNCKAQFYLRYIEHFLWPAPAADDMLAFERDRLAGSRFHQLAHQYLLGIPAEIVTNNAADKPDDRVLRWFELFLRTVGRELSGNLWPEHMLTARLDGFILGAKYDLIRQEERIFTIYDWKTSRKKPSKDWLEAQLQSKIFPLVLNQELSSRAGADQFVIRMLYWEVTEPWDQIVLECGPEKIEESRKLVTSLIRQLNSAAPADFSKTDDIRRCRYCVYRTYCNRPPEPAGLDDYLSETYLVLEDEAEILTSD
ncbi:MAG: PD-(D/E)XK nuclease family protein [Chloroflexi bacterium]|nr:PD-(D/E)XK nuclease family protein [Chloroflexota bacterium]